MGLSRLDAPWLQYPYKLYLFPGFYSLLAVLIACFALNIAQNAQK
jgi:hypothetical protein